MTGPPAAALHMVVLKVASRCNLACTYCYVYESGDDSWRGRPVVMADATFTETLGWIRRQVVASGRRSVLLLFHGGEPMLVGPERFDAWCREATAALGGEVAVGFSVQTNGVLVDERWVEVFHRHRVTVGVSLDGPPAAHDRHRVDHRGRGSYDRVRAGIERLRAGGVTLGLLSVIDFEQDPLEVHRHMLDLGVTDLGYLFPDHTHETVGRVRARYGPTPVADWLIPVFDEWWSRDSVRVRVRELDGIVAAVLRRRAWTTFYGNPPLGYLWVEADGAIEGLDVLRICEPGLAGTGLTVRSTEPLAEALPEFHRRVTLDGVPLPAGCGGCPEATTCGGGFLPHRFSRARRFDNPSAWCADLFRLFGHVRERLGVPRPDPSARLAAGAGRR